MNNKGRKECDIKALTMEATECNCFFYSFIFILTNDTSNSIYFSRAMFFADFLSSISLCLLVEVMCVHVFVFV